MAKKTKRTAATIPDDVLLEILFSVSTDVGALFRCAATCKQWRALIADPCFLRRLWPENTGHASAFLGFFVQQRRRDDAERYTSAGRVDIDSPEPPVFVPAPLHPMLGDHRRFLTSFFTGVPGGLLDGAKRVTARHGLLLVRLAYGFRDDSPSWSAPRSCFGDKIWSKQKPGFWMPFWNTTQPQHQHNVVCGGMAHGLAVYQSRYLDPKKYHIFNVSIETGHVSLTELSIQADQLTTSCYGWPVLSVGVDRILRLFCVYNETGLPRLDMWTRRGDNDRGSGTFWLRVGVFDLKSPEERWLPWDILVWSGEKSGVMFIVEGVCFQRLIDLGT
uniref:Uncharacterized protein n=1 Tax=Aegilops tauschii TaxID=37682 RepID=M8BG61_AEGTA